MKPEIWERAKEIFEQVADEPSGARTAVLESACGGDDELKSALNSLLAAHDRAAGFLNPPTIPGEAYFAQSGADPLEAGRVVEGPGTRIGRYRLLEAIGEGGFGAVFMAEQEQPVRRRVALKIIKPGMDSRQVIARFEAERQAVAMMDHPNIARVLDAGETGSGRPYFVMELVRGDPITGFCQVRTLDLDTRLALFRDVCHAVQHAHQKGVIHRDLKPTNILVTSHDGRPVPKVIDFGISKATHGTLTDRTLFTEYRQLIGTPAYMSPEQAEMSGLDIDTRSDVYSLGVLLYELLTDTTPFDNRKLLSGGISEMQRTIREVQPQRPSARLAKATRRRSDEATQASRAAREPEAGAAREPEAGASPGPAVTAKPLGSALESGAGVPARRVAGTEARPTRNRPVPAIPHDLDRIVMKCLEKDRRRRYATVGDLAADIERFLRHEPVLAGPPSALYRFSKFARRHRGVIVLTGVALLATLAGLAFAITGYLAAEHARADAVAQGERAAESASDARHAAASAEAASRFLEQILASADPREAGRSDLTVRSALDRAVQKLDAGELENQPRTEAGVRATIGRAYRELALFERSRGEFERASALFRRLGMESGPTWAAFLQQRGALYKALRDFSRAEEDLREALRIRRETEIPAGPQLTAVLNDLATVLMDQARMDEAAVLLAEASDIAEGPLGGGSAAVAEIRNNFAYIFAGRGDWAEAERLFRAAIEWNRAQLGPHHPTLATNLDNLAQVLVQRRDPIGGEAAYREALAIRRAAFAGDHPELATTLHNLGTLLWSRGDAAGAEEMVCESFEMFRRIYGLGDENTLVALNSLVSIFGARGALELAEYYLRDAFSASEGGNAVGDATRQKLARRLSDLFRATGRAAEAAMWEKRAAEYAK